MYFSIIRLFFLQLACLSRSACHEALPAESRGLQNSGRPTVLHPLVFDDLSITVDWFPHQNYATIYRLTSHGHTVLKLLVLATYWPHVFLEETACLEDHAIGICSFSFLAGSLIYNHG